MRTLYQTLEQLALELPHEDDISQAARAVTLIFYDEIVFLPWVRRAEARAKLNSPRTCQHLITLVLRSMQRHARSILADQGGSTVMFSVDSAALVQHAWDALGVAPAWLAFETQIDKLASQEEL